VCPSSAAYRPKDAPPPAIDAAIARIAARQHGAITLLQLLAIGLTRSGVARRVRSGRLHRIRDITIFRGIPVTTMARTLVDLTDVLTEHQLANVIHEAAFHNRFSEPATRAAMARAPGRNLAVLESAFQAHASGSAGTKSDLEDQVLTHIQATNLPAPLVNAGFQTPHKLIEVDLIWPTERLVVEVDGRGHARPRTQRKDAQRNCLLTEAGFEVVRVKPPPRLHPAADPRPP
jgi:very-short-patch-repair endonuclease